MLTCQYPSQAILLTDGNTRYMLLFMNRKRFFLIISILVSFFIWGICPWNNSSVAAGSFHSTHAAHGHPTGHEEERHHASKGYDHGCINPISYNKEDVSSHLDKSHSSVAASFLDVDTCVYVYYVSIAQSHLISTYPSGSFIPLYQLYSVYRI